MILLSVICDLSEGEEENRRGAPAGKADQGAVERIADETAEGLEHCFRRRD